MRNNKNLLISIAFIVASATILGIWSWQRASTNEHPLHVGVGTQHFDNPLDSISAAPRPSEEVALKKLEIADEAWLGLWRGQWEGTLDTYIMLMSQEDNRLKAYYSWGTNLNVLTPGSRVVEGVIIEGVITFPIQAGYSIVLKKNIRDEYLEGIFYSPDALKPSRAIFLRAD